MNNAGCNHCKWAKDYEEVGAFFRSLFKLPKGDPVCRVNKLHPLFKQLERDHRGQLLTTPKNQKLLRAIVEKLDPKGVEGAAEDCGLNIKFDCPLFHHNYTKITQQELDELLLNLKVEYVL